MINGKLVARATLFLLVNHGHTFYKVCRDLDEAVVQAKKNDGLDRGIHYQEKHRLLNPVPLYTKKEVAFSPAYHVYQFDTEIEL